MKLKVANKSLVCLLFDAQIRSVSKLTKEKCAKNLSQLHEYQGKCHLE